jgi:hypothetical protein
VDDVVAVVLAFGTCPPVDGCGGSWDLVCGCDGETCSNEGGAIAAGANVAYVGECGPK